jgi:uncharacterized Zn-binding protein involved in type VI secretion
MRVAAVLAIPTLFALAACSGGSSGFVGNNIGTGGQQANVRFVNGSPDLGSVDFYFQATGAAAPGAPASSTTAGVGYPVVTPFVAESPTAATIIVRAAGSSSSGPALDSLSCPIPQLATNAKYTVAIAGIGSGNHRCLIFQDFDYSAAAQYRMHNASMTAAASIAYSTAATSTPPATAVPYNSSQVANKGGNASSGSATYTPVQPAGPIGNPTSNPEFVVGPNTGGPTFPVQVGLNASALFASGSTTQPDTSGSLNFPSTAGSSVFAIDCTPAAVAAFSGVQCNGGIALIGTFDTL